MKVYIGPYKHWIGPYQIARKILFWMSEDIDSSNYKKDYVSRLANWLATNKNGDDSWVMKFCSWLDTKRKRNVKVRIDEYDTWNLDSTLGHIITPALKKLKKDKTGIPFVENEDVPDALKGPVYEFGEDWSQDENFEKRWDWVLDEMIFAFEMLHKNWDEQYYEKEKQINYAGIDEMHTRIQNGFRLFGKYYQSLWT